MKKSSGGKRKPSVSKLKKKAWSLFSTMIRLRDTDKYYFGKCITCTKTFHFKELQAGHFISRRHSATLFEVRNVHAQCCGCNIFKAGDTINYWKFMEETYGRPVINELIYLSQTTRRFTVEELVLMCEVFKAKIKFYELKKVQSLSEGVSS